MNLDELFAHLQNKYPEHDFAWRKSGKYWVGFCPEHEDKRTPNFMIMPNEENNDDYHAFCFTCGHYEPIGEHTPLMKDLATMKEFLKEQLENRESRFYKYLVSRIPELGSDDEVVSSDIKNGLLKLDVYVYKHDILFDKLQDEKLKEKIDQISILKSHSFHPALATSGTSGFTQENLKSVLKIASNKDKTVFLVADWDKAGREALNRFVYSINKEFIKHKKIYMFNLYTTETTTKDLDELLRDKIENAAEIIEDLAKYAVPLLRAKQIADELENKKKEKEKQEILRFYSDGFVNLINQNDQNQDKQIKVGVIDLPYRDHFILEPYIPYEAIILFDGLGELGKSLLAMQLTLCLAAGKPFLSFKTKEPQKPVLYLTAEEDEYAFNDRLKKLMKGLNITNTDLAGNFRWLSIYSEDFQCPTYRLLRTAKGEVIKTEFYNYLINIIARFNPKLVILDSLVNWYGLNENDGEQASIFMETLKMVSKEYNCSFLLLHHQTKEAMRVDGEKLFRGSMVFREQSRARITLQRVNNDVKKLELEKLNHFSSLRRDVYLSLATVDENNEQIICFYETDKPIEKETEKKINKGKGGTPHDEA